MCELFTYINSFFSGAWSMISSSGLIEAAIGSAFGAFGGAYCLWAINRKKEYETTLSKINYVIAMLISHMNSLLNFKKQHAEPFVAEMNYIIDAIDNPAAHAQDGVLEISAHKIFCRVTETEFNTNGLLETLSTHAGLDTKSVLLAMKTVEALASVRDFILIREQLISGLEVSTIPKEDKIKHALGKKEINGRTDTKFVDVTNGLLYHTNVSLHFIDLLIPRVQKIGEKVLPRSYKKRIAKNEFVGEYASLIPPKDFVPGWND